MRDLAIVVMCALFLPSVHASQQKVIVLGFDGVDARYTEKWMNEGTLPKVAGRRQLGTFRPARTAVAARTPVPWSPFSTGIDPGRTGIFDFLRRDPKTYLPLFAAFDETKEPFLLGEKNPVLAAVAVLIVLSLLALIFRRAARVVILAIAVIAAVGAYVNTRRYIPISRPGVINRRQGIPFWEAAANAGKKSTVVHVPVTFPAHDFPAGELLSGLGVPDLSGRIGKPFYFTSELDFHRAGSSNEFSIDVVQLEDNKGVIPTKIQGPPNKLFGNPPYIFIPMTLTVADDRNSVEISVSGQRFSLRPGQWSGWTEFVFPFNPLIKVHGISRFHLISSQPELKLYLSPINFDPRKLPPGFKISAPRAWASELANSHGLYKTLGWQIDTWAISEGFATEQMFWDDMNWTVTQDRKMFDSFLNNDSDLLVQQFEFPDRVGHVFWRLMDPQHPAYNATLVPPGAEYAALKRELKQKLVAMVDPETGDHPVRRVLSREEVYRQFDPNMIPDLFVTNNDGYRVSWQTSLGGIPKQLIEPNKQVWSGDHCSVDPEIVKGIFFYNRKLNTDRAPYIADVYPTVLGLLGVKAPYELDGVELR